MFYWEDNVLDPNVTPLNGASQETFGEGTTLEKVDDVHRQVHLHHAFPRQVIFALAYGTFCPGPAHMLKPQHPKYSKNTYDQYRNAFPATYMNMPVMGAWVPVEYRSDDIVVMRRNPYYWKVDEEGHQLPYLDELQYRLSTWADRDVQAVAGTGDFSNLEQPESYVEALKRSADPAAPARLAFGPRSIGYTLFPNLSGNGWGEPDARGQAVRELNRNLDFRKAVTMAIDRQRLGKSLVKGPFTAIYPGGIMDVTGFYDKDSTVYYPYDLDAAKAELEKAGLKDTDGDGFVNLPGRRRQRRGHAAGQRRLRHRQEPRRGHRRDDGAARHPGDPEHPLRQRPRRRAARRQVRLAAAPQRPGAGHGGAEHQRSSRRSARRPRCSHRRRTRGELDLLRLREADGRRPQRLHRAPTTPPSARRRSRTSRRPTPRTSTASG